jgi:hypothetical protein
MSDKDDCPISQLFAKKSKKPSNFNEDDQPIRQLFLKKPGNLKDDQGKPSKSPKKPDSNMSFARAKDPKQNVLQGQRLELTDDHEIRQVFVEKKT